MVSELTGKNQLVTGVIQAVIHKTNFIEQGFL
jgi:hypothetical protein